MLASGQLLSQDVDLVVQDLIPIRLERTYRSLDLTKRQFGVGMTSNYEVFLWRPTTAFTQYELINPDGTRVRYDRTSPGTSYTDAVFETPYPGIWSGSRLTYNNRLSGWDLTFRDGRRWSFNHAHRLTEVADRHGNALLITRQSGTSGPITRIDAPSGRWVEFTIGTTTSTSGLATQAKDSGGRTVTYTYDTTGRLTQVTDAAGATHKYTYTTSNYVETIVDAENRLVVHNEYGPKGRVAKQTLANGSTFEFTYTLETLVDCFPNGPCNVRDGEQIIQTDVKDRSGNVRRVSFRSGYIYRDVYPLGAPEERVTTFDLAASNGRLTARTDALGRRTEYLFDAQGNLAKVTRLAGTAQAAATEYTYTADGQTATIKDPLGHITVNTYDARGNLARVEDATGRKLEFTYDDLGRLTSSRIGSGNPTLYTYEGADIIAVTGPDGLTTEFIRDALGRVVGRRTPGGLLHRYEYDGRDRVTKYVNPLGHITLFAYDKTGRMTSYKDPRGKETLYSYNSLGLLAEQMDPLGRTSVYGYDTAGRPSTYRDPKGQVRGWGYDAAGRLVLQGFGATASSPEAYASTIELSYEDGGRRLRVEDSLGPVMTRTYDNLGRLTQEVSPTGTVDYTYDAAGRRTGLTATGQSPITYGYDNADRLTSITQGSRVVSFTYDASGRRATTTLPGGVTQTYTYDAADRLARIEYAKGSTVLGDLTYTYDAEGNRISVGGTYARTLLPNGFTGAVYDAANQLVGWQGRTVSHDANGNVTSDGLKTYTWDDRNQLSQVSSALGTLATFGYEPTGRRSRKTVSGSTRDYLYSGANFIQEQSGGTTASLLTGFDMDEVYSRDTPTGSRDFLSDMLGSTIALSDGTGTLAAEYTYEPFGAATHTGSTEGNSQTFTGREDDGTGLYYFRARYYDPQQGRFLQPEPLAQYPGYLVAMALQGNAVEAYAYAGNNPLRYVDPDGLSKFDKFFGLPKKFWNWAHRNEMDDVDLSKDEALELYEEWLKKGKPGPDKKRNQRGCSPDDDAPINLEDILDMIIPAPPIINPCLIMPSLCRSPDEPQWA
jgi:RHS repeat-associated protein